MKRTPITTDDVLEEATGEEYNEMLTNPLTPRYFRIWKRIKQRISNQRRKENDQ